ncbi:MAG TPA: hypothetical protein VGJ45_00320 [Pseudonocardiaceae bacterium]|jgi:hypothetical protein
MTQPNAVRVTPEELTTLADALTAASEAIRQVVYQDPVMLSDAQVYAEYFGPPQETAQQYVQLAHNFLTYVTGAMDQLSKGGEVFRTAAAGFAALDAQHAKAIQAGTQPR